MAQNLNEEQRKFIQDTIRPHIEALVKIRYDLQLFLDEYNNQQDQIEETADTLNDGDNGTSPRSDAPQLTGAKLKQLANFSQAMLNQISNPALSELIKVSVRPLSHIVKDR